nr:hypothetical protein [Sinisalibacter lacisalsi]
MQIAADVLLGAGALGAAVYCYVLARRLKRFNNLENGVGGAVAVLSAQVDDMTKTLDQARKAAAHSSQTLTALTERAELSARKLELMMASLHDLPDEKVTAPREVRAGDDEAGQDEAWEKAARSMPGDVPREDAAPLFATRRSAGAGGKA